MFRLIFKYWIEYPFYDFLINHTDIDFYILDKYVKITGHGY